MLDQLNFRNPVDAVNRIEPVAGQVPLRSEFAVLRATEAIGETGIRGWAQQPATPPAAAGNLVLAQAQGASGVPANTAPTPDDLTLARLAQTTGNTAVPLPTGWRPATSDDLLRIGIQPAQLSSENSTFRAAVYVRGSGDQQQTVVAFGASQATFSDWATNFTQPLGIPTDHYTRALLIGSNIADSGAPNVTIIGHSLGGGLASTAAIASGREAVTFNAAGLSNATIDAARREAAANGISGVPDIRAYYVRGEVLSSLQDGGDRVAGALLGAAITRSVRGATLGARIADAPEAFGQRIPLDLVGRPGAWWFQNNPIAAHGMDFVVRGMEARNR